MNSPKKNLALLIALIVLFLGGLLLTKSRLGSSSERVAVGLNLPLSGPIAAFMSPYPDALTMGMEDQFVKLGLPRDSFRLDIQDNGGKPAQAISVVQQQLLRGFDVYISGSSEMSAAILPKIDAKSVPHFLIAFDAYMTSKGANRLRVLPHYKLEGPLWVDYVQRIHARRVALITLDNAPIEEEFTELVEPGLKQLGVSFIRERFEWTGSDYRTVVAKVQRYKPDAVLVNGYSVHLYPIISALRGAGIVKQENVLASLDFDDLLYNGTPKADLSGVAFITPLFEVTDGSELVQQWKRRFESRFNKRATYVAAYAYDTGSILAAAAAKKSKPSKGDILAVIPWNGVAGEIRLDSVGDLNSTLVLAKLDSSQKPVSLFP